MKKIAITLEVMRSMFCKTFCDTRGVISLVSLFFRKPYRDRGNREP
jgi:hypothetical protein